MKIKAREKFRIVAFVVPNKAQLGDLESSAATGNEMKKVRMLTLMKGAKLAAIGSALYSSLFHKRAGILFPPVNEFGLVGSERCVVQLPMTDRSCLKGKNTRPTGR